MRGKNRERSETCDTAAGWALPAVSRQRLFLLGICSGRRPAVLNLPAYVLRKQSLDPQQEQSPQPPN
jgi:hypothetical protein